MKYAAIVSGTFAPPNTLLRYVNRPRQLTRLSSPRKRGPIFQSRWLWVPAFAGTTGGNLTSGAGAPPCDGGEGSRAAVEPQRQTEGRAAAAQEGGKRRGHDVVAALVEFRAQAPPAARHDQRLAEADGVGGKAAAVLDSDLDARLRRDPLADRPVCGRGGRAPPIHDLAAGQGSERRVHVIEALVREFERHHLASEHVRDRVRGRRVGARAVAHPEQIAPLVPNAVAGAFEHEALGQLSHRIDEAARLQRSKGCFEMRFLALTLRMPEARQQCLAIEHDGRIRGEDEIGQAGDGRDQLDRRAELHQFAMQRRPFALRRGVRAGIARPAHRVHPRIDGVADREVLGPAHQETRGRSVVHRHFSSLPLVELTQVHAARVRRVPSSSRRTSSKRSSAQSRSVRAMTSGGARRTTVWCVSFDSTPFASSRSHAARAPATAGSISAPTHRPRPRTSLSAGLAIARRRSSIWAPSTRLFSTSPSSRITCSASSPTPAAAGLPPQLQPCDPGVNTSMTSRRATKADTGSTPPPSALPRIRPSGRMPSCSKANQAPVRPKPDCTSSRISSTRCASQTRRRPAMKPAGGTMMPASPWIGSTSPAAGCGGAARPTPAGTPAPNPREPGRHGPE